jgi:hypothetical protein
VSVAAEEPTFETPPEHATEHEIAEGIRDGRYASPTKVGGFHLFDVRVTGTGMAYRDGLDEWAYRDPELWLSDEFLERAASVPVIFDHPEGSGLNSEEYRDRAVGNTVLSYRKGDEVRGVAKIFDDDVALLMQTTHRSTSPGVTPPKGSEAIVLKDGTKVLAEGLPLILDHLAICEVGVWDKDGPPDGIRLDARKDPAVADEDLEKVKKERDDAMAKVDAFEKDAKARKDAADAAAKKDAEESEREAIKAAEKEKADKAKKDAADAKKRDSRKDRHAKHDGEIMDCSRCDSEESEEEAREKKEREKERDDKARKDAEAAAKTPVDADRGMELHDSKLADLEARFKRQSEQIDAMHATPSIEDANELATIWGRWDSLYQMLGEPSKRAYPGEKPRAFLRRCADGVRQYTKSWKNYTFHDSQQMQDFSLVADAIYREALEHSKQPITDKPGFLREVVTHPHGKTRTEFFGDHRTAWLPFMHPTKFALTKVNRPTGNVYGQG